MKKSAKKPVRRALKPQPRVPAAPVPREGLDAMLMKLIMGASELSTERTRIEFKSSPYGVQQETREGIFVNANGVQHRIRENLQYVSTYKDGTPAGKSGLVQCQTCGEVVSVESLQRCPCGKTCCISKGCGVYVERHAQWYCCKKHALMGMCRLNLRFFS